MSIKALLFLLVFSPVLIFCSSQQKSASQPLERTVSGVGTYVYALVDSADAEVKFNEQETRNFIKELRTTERLTFAFQQFLKTENGHFIKFGTFKRRLETLISIHNSGQEKLQVDQENYIVELVKLRREMAEFIGVFIPEGEDTAWVDDFFLAVQGDLTVASDLHEVLMATALITTGALAIRDYALRLEISSSAKSASLDKKEAKRLLNNIYSDAKNHSHRAALSRRLGSIAAILESDSESKLGIKKALADYQRYSKAIDARGYLGARAYASKALLVVKERNYAEALDLTEDHEKASYRELEKAKVARNKSYEAAREFLERGNGSRKGNVIARLKSYGREIDVKSKRKTFTKFQEYKRLRTYNLVGMAVSVVTAVAIHQVIKENNAELKQDFENLKDRFEGLTPGQDTVKLLQRQIQFFEGFLPNPG